MSEEKKDVSAQLTDEAVEEATGGNSDFEIEINLVTRDYVCPNCQFVYSFIVPQTDVITPPNCPRCGYPGRTRSIPHGSF